MIQGEKVTVYKPVEGEADAYGVPSIEWRFKGTVENVLVAPAGTSDLEPGMRSDGDSVTLTLHFPKAFTESLRGMRIVVREKTWQVIGDPQTYSDQNVPGEWNRPVTVRLVEG